MPLRYGTQPYHDGSRLVCHRGRRILRAVLPASPYEQLFPMSISDWDSLQFVNPFAQEDSEDSDDVYDSDLDLENALQEFALHSLAQENASHSVFIPDYHVASFHVVLSLQPDFCLQPLYLPLSLSVRLRLSMYRLAHVSYVVACLVAIAGTINLNSKKKKDSSVCACASAHFVLSCILLSMHSVSIDCPSSSLRYFARQPQSDVTKVCLISTLNLERCVLTSPVMFHTTRFAKWGLCDNKGVVRAYYRLGKFYSTLCFHPFTPMPTQKS